LIESPLIVLVVFAAMIPPIERLLARVRLPALVRVFALEKKLMLPVEPLPNCNVCLFVVPRTPVPVSNVALLPLPAEIEAVGTPPATLVNANFALVVACDPSSKSSVVFLWKIEPFPSLNGEPPLTTGRIPDTSCVKSTKLNVGLAPPCRTVLVPPAGVCWSTPLTSVYKGPPAEVNALN